MALQEIVSNGNHIENNEEKNVIAQELVLQGNISKDISHILVEDFKKISSDNVSEDVNFDISPPLSIIDSPVDVIMPVPSSPKPDKADNLENGSVEVPIDYTAILDQSLEIFQDICSDLNEATSNDSSEYDQTATSEDSCASALDCNGKEFPESVVEDGENNFLVKDDHDCLSHPEYTLALKKIKENEHCISDLKNTISRLREVVSVESSKSGRIRELEQSLSQSEREVELGRQEHELDARALSALKREMDIKCSQLKKDYETANRERENMVMRYAVSEKELMDVRKEKEVATRKLKEATRENETLMEKLKNVVGEKSKLSQQLDSKNTEVTTTHKEIDKLKEEINARDIKIKWTQNKLKTEMELYKDCPAQLEKLSNKIKLLEDNLHCSSQECQNLKKQLQETEQNKLLECQLMEEQAKLIMERHEHLEIESKYKTLQGKHQAIIEENNSLSFQVQHLETERLGLEQKLTLSREEARRLSGQVSELQVKLAELDPLKIQLARLDEKVEALSSEAEMVRRYNEELLVDMRGCRSREAEMLSFTQKLTTKNVQLQSEFSSLEAQVNELEKANEKWGSEVRELKEKLKETQRDLDLEKKKRGEETQLLAREVAERTTRGRSAEAELQDTKAMLSGERLKHVAAIKELQRELSGTMRKLEKFEQSGGSLRKGYSVGSLTTESFAQATGEVPTASLVERILRLQADSAKQSEKIEFLEEHSAQLLSELQKKSRLLQSYMLREEAGALAPSYIDEHKVEICKHKGIMASLYSGGNSVGGGGGGAPEGGITLELSLEINRKLQSVLEEVLLKNIMLKENMDTLGDEIARLTKK